MGIFKLDSPITRFLMRVADLMILNVVAMACCFPVITVGASLTALHYMSLKMVRGEEGYLMKGFFKSFKDNFKQATIIWVILLLAVMLVVLDFVIMAKSGLEFGTFIKVVICVIAVLLACIFIYVFAILAKFDNTVKNTIKNALFMSIHQFPQTVLMLIIYLVPVVIILLIPEGLPLVFMFGLTFPVYMSALLYNKFFKKLEESVIAAHTPAQEEESEPTEQQTDKE